jgi:ATP-dependent DNA helicase RecQ
MLGNEDYDMNWLKKLEVYSSLYPGQLIKTYESGVLTLDVQKKIEEIKELSSLGD